MQPFDEIEKYSEIVCQQIRWKKAKSIIATEVENHLCDQRDAYIASGDGEKSATDKAILQMGDAVFVGQELDKTHKPNPQWKMIVLSGILMIIGAFSNYFISLSETAPYNFSFFPYIMAFGVFIACYFIDFTMLGKYSLQCYFFIIIISLISIILGSGINGRLTWLVGRFAISLSYLSLIFPLAFTLLIYAMRNKGYRGILLSGIGFLPLAAILIIVPTITGLILYTLSALTVLCFAICKGWFSVDKKQGLLIVLIPTFVVFTVVLGFIVQSVYASNRLSVFLNPYEDRLGAGYVYSLVRDFLSESTLFGTGGTPQSVADIANLPNVSTNYSLVYLIHQMGFVVLFSIMVFIILFSVVGIHKALKQKNALGSLITLGIMLTFIFQSIFYIADNLGYGLVSSLSLPFISYGNSALFINAALIGFMLSVFRTGDIFKDSITLSSKDNSFLSYKDGRLIIDFRRRQI